MYIIILWLNQGYNACLCKSIYMYSQATQITKFCYTLQNIAHKNFIPLNNNNNKTLIMTVSYLPESMALTYSKLQL